MMIRFTYLASALSLAAAQKASKTPTTPSPKTLSPKTAKTIPASMSLQAKSSKTGANYIIAPFSCPRECISVAGGVTLATMELDDAVTTCDASDEDQMWKVHQSGTFLKFESAAQYDEGMCLAVVHPDPTHESNRRLEVSIKPTPFFLEPFFTYIWPLSSELSEDDVDEMCTGQLGLADCDHPGSYWYNTGGQYLSALCWNQGVSAVMSVDESCTDLMVTNSTDLTTSETFMLLNSE